MADETGISTPTDTAIESTSANETVENTTDTSDAELETNGEVAETETTQENAPEEKLYAGKYKSVEELEKGYGEAQKFVTKANELQKKYDALVQQKEDEARKAYEARQDEAKKRGFMTADDAEIADKVQLAEFEYYAQNLNTVDPDLSDKARRYLLAYYQTGHAQYLDEAKKLYSPAFIENVAQAKNAYYSQLKSELQTKNAQRDMENEQKLADVLKVEYKDFLADIKENEGKALALQGFCGAGFIKSQEDMKTFQDIYTKIAERERAQAIKEYEAQKAIAATKEKAVLEAPTTSIVEGGEKLPTLAQISAMSQDEYNRAFKKYGNKLLLAN